MVSNLLLFKFPEHMECKTTVDIFQIDFLSGKKVYHSFANVRIYGNEQEALDGIHSIIMLF